MNPLKVPAFYSCIGEFPSKLLPNLKIKYNQLDDKYKCLNQLFPLHECHGYLSTIAKILRIQDIYKVAWKVIFKDHVVL